MARCAWCGREAPLFEEAIHDRAARGNPFPGHQWYLFGLQPEVLCVRWREDGGTEGCQEVALLEAVIGGSG